MSGYTKLQLLRMAWFPEVGCIACIQQGLPKTLLDVAHETNGGRREGPFYTFPLCPYHHRGVMPDGFNSRTAEERFGPSFALSKRRFEERYGTESELVEMTDAFIAKLKQKMVIGMEAAV